MRASFVVEAQIRGQVSFRIGNAVIGLEIHLLVLDRLPQALDEDVVPPGPLAVHADPDVVCLEQTCELVFGERATLVDVEDLRASIPVEGFPHRVQTEVGCQGVGESPGKDLPENQSITASR